MLLSTRGGVGSRGHKDQGQGHKKISKPRTDPLEAKAKDQGHRRKCSRKKKKKGLQKFFFRRSQKKGPQNFFSGEKGLQKFFFRRSLRGNQKKVLCRFSARFLAFSNELLTVQKYVVLSSSRGQGNFRGLETSRLRPRTSKCVLEAKDVLEDSTSVKYIILNLKAFTRISFIKFSVNKKDNLS